MPELDRHQHTALALVVFSIRTKLSDVINVQSTSRPLDALDKISHNSRSFDEFHTTYWKLRKG